MAISTDGGHGAGTARTYIPEAGARDEIRDFAELVRELDASFEQSQSKAALVDPRGQARPVPDEIFRILDQVTNALAAGEGVTIVPQSTTMTTQQAAEFLGISRPTLVRLLEAGDIPFDKPGRHRRVRLGDLIAYQRKFRTDRRDALRELRQTSPMSKIQIGNPEEVKRLAELEP